MTIDTERVICRKERRLFFNEWCKHPAQLGTLAPITMRFADRVAALLDYPKQQRVVEVGAGTGRLTRALLRAGIRPRHLAAVELNPHLRRFLDQNWGRHIAEDKPCIIEGDALFLPELLPSSFMGQTDVVISVIPFRYLSRGMRANFIAAAIRILKPTGYILHISYHPFSPIPSIEGWTSRRCLSLWCNVPPAFVFELKKAG